jgi:aminoglycoside phosphotransferase (APT) family kinase protein
MNESNAGAFKPLREAAQQDWKSLAEYLAARGHALSRDPPPRQFASGFGNLNYLIELDGEQAVLRRPPLGPIPPGANDMRREDRIFGVLWQAYPLAPRSLLFCGDEAVLGAPFFIMQYRPGMVIGGALPKELPITMPGRDRVGRRLGPMIVCLLAELHGVDTAAIGLDDFGRPDGFVERTVGGWLKRAALAWDGEAPGLVRELDGWFARNMPHRAQTPTLLHNDFKLDNIVLDPGSLEPVAVLDWDLGTRGDPLIDLGVTLSYWVEAKDPWAMHAIEQMPTAGHGFPSRREAVDLYAQYTGRDLSDILFYRVFGQFRIAVVFMQLNRRYREGGTKDPRFAEFGRMAEGLLEFAHEIALGRAF